MEINFSRDQWNTDEITYAYSYRFTDTPTFVQRETYIENQKNEQASQGYDNISLLTKEKYTAGTRISAQCSFDHFGAPIIVIADELHPDENGTMWIGNYLEIVIYEKGINVWQMYENDRTITWDYLMSVDFPVTAKEIHTLSVEVQEKALVIYADDRKMMLHIKDLYPSFHIGINACENVNQFYSMNVEKVDIRDITY